MIQFCKAYRKEPEDISEMEFARSKSGHDKNQIYLIKEKDEKFVYLVNGTTVLCAEIVKAHALDVT